MAVPIVAAAGINAGSSIANNLITQAFAGHNRRENYRYNEMAAKKADQRQRAQYMELYSPQAMMEQYAAAGLSPSLMMSGGQSAVGQSSAQGNQSAGIQGPYPSTMPIDPLTAAQMANIIADTEGKRSDNTIKDIEAQLRKKSQILESAELDLISTYIFNQESKTTESLMQAAARYDKYDDFVKYISNDVNIQNNELSYYIKTQAGQNTLQNIYKSAHDIDKEVAQIEGDKEYANIMLAIYQKLNEGNFAQLSADERLSELRKIVENNNLEADKKETINKIFNGIENENLRSFLMVMYMLGDRYLGSISASYSANRGFNTNTNTSTSTSHNYNSNQSSSTSTNYNYNYKR